MCFLKPRFLVLAAVIMTLQVACGGGGSMSGSTSQDRPPSNLMYGRNPVIYILNSPITPNYGAFQGTYPGSFSVTPPLPTGLSLAGQTGTISGTATIASQATDYTVTVSNSFGTTHATINIAVLDPHRGAFSSVNNLKVARSGHSTTLLPNGDLLLVGGVGDGGNPWPLNSAELYDSASGNFTLTGSLATARTSHTATLLPNGKVLIAGGVTGISSPTILSSAELYDPASGTFSPAGSLNVARAAHTATLMTDGKVLIVGGVYNASTGAVPIASTEVYDPNTNSFSLVGSLVTPRYFHTATLLTDGEVFVVGGEGPDGNSLASTETYNPNNRSFSTTGSMNSARSGHSSTLLPNGKVLIAGGLGDFDHHFALSSTEIYDPASMLFSEGANLSEAKYSHTALLLQTGFVIIIGGVNNTSAIASSTTELYIPELDVFTYTGHLITGRYSGSSTLLPDGRVLVTGGIDGGDATLSTVELYQ